LTLTNEINRIAKLAERVVNISVKDGRQGLR
jgi:hypothetical protein